MIKGFEKQTIELNDHELNVVSILVDRFSKKPGYKNIVTNNQIIEGLRMKHGIEIKDSRVRKVIQYIRVNNLIPGLIATSKGYYSTDDIEELESWIESMVQRENAIRETRLAIENHLIHLKNERTDKNNQGNQFNLEFDFR